MWLNDIYKKIEVKGISALNSIYFSLMLFRPSVLSLIAGKHPDKHSVLWVVACILYVNITKYDES